MHSGISEASLAAGTTEIWTGLPKLPVILAGGFTTNFLWCCFLSVKNRSGYEYLAKRRRNPQAAEESPEQLNDEIPLLRNYFFSALAGVTEPEAKRKAIGELFIRVFEDAKAEAADAGGTHAEFLVQGTLYPDVIASGSEHASTIKSHHNVGGLPEDMEFELIEPLRSLFKDEVRMVGSELGLPDEIVQRQPFPGPGLGVRIIGEVTPDKVETLQHADFIVREELAKAGLSAGDLAEINQLAYSAEQVFTHEEGLPRRPWFRHHIYAPGFYTGYGVKTLPGIREAIEEMSWDEAATMIRVTAQRIDEFAARLETIRAKIEG